MRRNRPAPSTGYVLVQAYGLLLLLVIGLVLSTPVRAAETPSGFVERLSDEATAVLVDASLSRAQRKAVFREMMQAYFDVDLISRVVLGKHWRSASDETRRAYRGLFESYVLTVYGRRLEGYAGETLEVGRARDKGKKGVFVASRLNRPQGAPWEVVWRLRRDGGTYRIVDVIVEGVSMVVTQRNEFDTVIRQGGGLESLLDRLRSVLARFKTPAAVQFSRR